MSAIQLSVVIPVYNEEQGLQALFDRLYPALDKLAIPYEVIFVNDGSRDRSAAILREHGFTVEAKGDLVAARYGKAARDQIRAHLEVLGRLLQFMRQLDVAMVDDRMVGEVARAFLEGRYRL